MNTLSAKLKTVFAEHLELASETELFQIASVLAAGRGSVRSAPLAQVPGSLVKLDAQGQPLPIDAADWVAVYDPVRQLEWLRGFVPGGRRNWKDSMAAASAVTLFGKTDWRACTIQERLTITDYGRFNPAIDTTFFDSEKEGWEWASTPYASSPAGDAWGVDFNGGSAGWGGRGDGGFVRAVRASQLIGVWPSSRG
jgi:Protein of unknown function (DUF1566)